MKKYFCILFAVMLFAMVPAASLGQTRSGKKPRVERKSTQKKASKKSSVKKGTTIKNDDDKDKKEDEIMTIEELKAMVTASDQKDNRKGTEDRTISRTIKEEVVLEKEPDSPQKADPDRVFKSVEQMPQFPGGEVALMRYLSTHINYPPEAAKNNIQGRVILQFVVEKDGSIGEVKVVRSVDEALDKEAIRVIKALPNFTPGRQDGKPVRVWYTLPVTFKLGKQQTEQPQP
ncbi:MAG: energy transducer TonB [Muribaculaceae bacterium]|nr:energy transducer TonB [Muribaculaceae bacterium]